jgi:ADP-ribose pyrophosphatase YjhB (NUDIX family)
MNQALFILGEVLKVQKDWFFSDESHICNFRTVGVLIRDNKILVQRDKEGDEYALPGGHVKIGETSMESLIREYKEEIGADINCQRLIWTEECFWNWNNKPANTIAFYYLVDLLDCSDIPDNGEFTSQKDNCNVVFGWIPIEQINTIKIYPEFIKEIIFNIGEHTQHFISRY